MDVDDNEGTSSIQNPASPSVVLNTSQTSWGRRLDMPTRPTSPLRTPTPPQAARDYVDQQEPAKKKQRSDVDHDPHVEEITPVVANKRDEPRISKTTTSRATLKQSSLKSYVASNNLRSRLASFAMPGSQLSVSSLPTVEVLDEDVGVEVRPDDTNEEVDELDGEPGRSPC
jgi:hypothetical protein